MIFQYLPYIEHLATLVCIYIIASHGMNLILGYTGLLNLGFAGCMAIGAYTATLLQIAGVPFLLALIIAVTASIVVSVCIGAPTLKLKGHYFAIATLALGEITRLVLLNWSSVTRGALGIPGIPKPVIFGITISGAHGTLILTAVFACTVSVIMYQLVRAPFGRVLEAIREDEQAVQTLGINTARHKLKAFIVAAAFAGVAGVLFAHTVQYIDPPSFAMHHMVQIVLMAVLGGMGNFWGGIIGSVILVLLPEPIRHLPDWFPGLIQGSAVGPLEQLAYGIVLIVVMMYRPDGVLSRTHASNPRNV